MAKTLIKLIHIKKCKTIYLFIAVKINNQFNSTQNVKFICEFCDAAKGDDNLLGLGFVGCYFIISFLFFSFVFLFGGKKKEEEERFEYQI